MSLVQAPVADPVSAYSFEVVRSEPPRCALAASGDLDLAAREDLRAFLNEQYDAECTFVRLDLSRVWFMDCSCLGVIVGAHNQFRAARGSLILTGVGAATHRLITLTGLSKTLFFTGIEGEVPVP